MSTGAILRRLQQDELELPPAYDQETLAWNFASKLGVKDIDFFRNLLKNHLALNLEYSIHCTQLAHQFHRKEKENEAELFQQIKMALIMAELLEHLNREYLNVPREVVRLRKEQEVFRRLLAHFDMKFTNPNNDAISPPVKSLTKNIRDQAVLVNFPRLMVVRTRRFLISISPFFDQMGGYNRLLASIDKYAGPSLNYISWIYFAPRLMTNLFILGKHLIPGSWMSETEKQLGWQARVNSHFDRRWFEVANDTVWLLGGLLNCFVFIGSLAPVGLYFSLALQAYDVFLASMRLHVEVGRLQTLKEEYLSLLKNLTVTREDKAEITEHLIYLEQRIDYEKKRFNIGIISNSAILLGLIIALPGIALFHPMIPVLAAFIILDATALAYRSSNSLEKLKPSDKISDLDFSPDSPTPRVSKNPQTFFRYQHPMQHSRRHSFSEVDLANYDESTQKAPELC